MALLEINIISALDLPPVSKTLRTFAVAYIHPDHKLTTKVDHQGHTNPTWNYRLAFHVDEDFLKQESSAITIEIYNVASLRDLPIGTTRLFINCLSPPLKNNPDFRQVSLQIARSSGHLQGTLNLGIQLAHSTFPGSELGVEPTIESDEALNDYEKIEDQDERRGIRKENAFIEEYLEDQVKNIPTIPETEILSDIGTHSTFARESKLTNKIGLGPGTSTNRNSTSSMFSTMRPLPSEVALDLKKGVYYSSDWNEYGSSLFENWTEPTSKEVGEHNNMRSNSAKWITEDQEPLTFDPKKLGCHRRSHSEGRGKRSGLMSCFGNAYGFEFKFICGSSMLKKKKNNKNGKRNVHKENSHKFYG